LVRDLELLWGMLWTGGDDPFAYGGRQDSSPHRVVGPTDGIQFLIPGGGEQEGQHDQEQQRQLTPARLRPHNGSIVEFPPIPALTRCARRGGRALGPRAVLDRYLRAEKIEELSEAGRVAGVGRLVVIVPLRKDAFREVRTLLRQGPPLELGRSGVERYQAFLSAREAILALEGPEVGKSDGPTWDDFSTWRNGPRWERCARSAPRLVGGIHAWERAPELKGVFFGPLPGPGDSEGGDAVGSWIP
jgi:hypothetical protein